MAATLVLTEKLMELPLEGQHLPAPNLKGILASAPLIWLQFLRHLSCIYCKGLVQDIRAFMQSWASEPRPNLIFVHPNTLAEGAAFFEEFYPKAPHISDPKLRLYQAFRVQKAGILAQIVPSNLWRFWELSRRGLSNERPTADPLVLHASFLFYNQRLIWKAYAKHLGDVPTWPREV